MTDNLSLIASTLGNSAFNNLTSLQNSYMYGIIHPLHVLSSSALHNFWELGHISSQNL